MKDLVKEKWWLLVLLCLVFFLRIKVFSLTYVPSESMVPTLQENDFLFATKYDKTNINRYDIVIFDYPTMSIYVL